MVRRVGIVTLALVGLMLTATAEARADDDGNPRAIYQRCLRKLRETVTRCHRHQAEVTEDCIARIKRLKRAGKREEAIKTARRCVNHLNEFSDKCVDEIRDICRPCIRRLVELDAPRLARQLNSACENAVEAVRQRQRRAVNAIEDALRG